MIEILNQWPAQDDVPNFCPKGLQQDIDSWQLLIQESINNGVYKTGFATEQSAYQKHCHKLFESLERAEKILESQPFLTGSNIVEADWRLFVTLLRFDPVYFFHFKCSITLLTMICTNSIRRTTLTTYFSS